MTHESAAYFLGQGRYGHTRTLTYSLVTFVLLMVRLSVDKVTLMSAAIMSLKAWSAYPRGLARSSGRVFMLLVRHTCGRVESV